MTTSRLIDVSHTVEHGMVTYKGLPAPVICDWLSREGSRAKYAPGTEFQIGKIELVANTGTYLDTPAHRYRGGSDIADVDIADVADLPAIILDCRWASEAAAGPTRGIGAEAFDRLDPEGRAVLLWTGWDRHWGTPAYLADNPFLTDEGAAMLVERGAALIGIAPRMLWPESVRS